MSPFSHGDPGSMNKVFTPTLDNQSRTLFAVNPGPLSLRIFRHAPMNEQVAQAFQDVLAREPLCYVDCQTFTGKLIHKSQHADRVPVGRAICDEVVTPDMVRMSSAEPDTGSIVEPEPPSPGLFSGDFQALGRPDTFHSFVVHSPAIPMEKGRYSTVPIASVITGKADHTAHQNWFIASNASFPTLCTPRLPNHTTSPTFADMLPAGHATDVINRFSSLRRAQYFPSATSRRIVLSSSASASSLLSQEFSFSSSLSRFAWSTRRPSNFFFQR